MKIQLPIWYFKESGKYYSEGFFDCDDEEETYHAIINRARAMLDAGKRPGLVDGPRTEFHALLVGNAHPGGFPVMFIRQPSSVEREVAQVEPCRWPIKKCTCPHATATELGPFNLANMAEFAAIHDKAIKHPLHVPRERLGSDTVCSCPACRRKA